MTRTLASALAMFSLGLAACGAPATAEHGAGVHYAQLPDDAYAVVADIRAKPGKEAELRNATLPLVVQVRNEPNNRLYFLHEDREAPGHFVFYEIFASRAHFEAHNATPHVSAWLARLPDLADGSVKVVRLQLLGNKNGSIQ